MGKLRPPVELALISESKLGHIIPGSQGRYIPFQPSFSSEPVGRSSSGGQSHGEPSDFMDVEMFPAANEVRVQHITHSR
jgi:hypothetical protein